MIKKILKRTAIGLYALFAVCLTLFSGCATAMPTRVPMLTEEFGYKVPQWKGWTFVFINQTIYKVESEKLRAWAVMQELTNRPAIALHGEAMNIFSMLATGAATGGIPLAWRHQPKKKIKKEEEE